MKISGTCSDEAGAAQSAAWVERGAVICGAFETPDVNKTTRELSEKAVRFISRAARRGEAYGSRTVCAGYGLGQTGFSLTTAPLNRYFPGRGGA